MRVTDKKETKIRFILPENSIVASFILPPAQTLSVFLDRRRDEDGSVRLKMKEISFAYYEQESICSETEAHETSNSSQY